MSNNRPMNKDVKLFVSLLKPLNLIDMVFTPKMPAPLKQWVVRLYTTDHKEVAGCHETVEAETAAEAVARFSVLCCLNDNEYAVAELA